MPTKESKKILYGNAAAEVYEELCGDHLANIRKLIRNVRPAPSSILDIGCGTGFLVRQLRKYGWRCVGIDLSNSMIMQARHRDPKGIYKLGDASEFSIGDRVDLLTSTCDVINHLKSFRSVDRFILCAARALVPHGTLIFDSITPFDIEHNWSNYMEYTPRENWSLVRVGKRLSRGKGILRYHYFIRDKGNAFRQSIETHRLTAWPLKSILNSLHQHGFSKIRVLDAQTLRKPRKDCVRWIFVASR